MSSQMTDQKFVYVSYIRTTVDELWNALTQTQFTRQYWMNLSVESDWRVGSSVMFTDADGKATLAGKILVSEKPKVLSYTWSQPNKPETQNEKPSQVTFLIENFDAKQGLVKLTVTHEGFPPDSNVFPGINVGWPMVLSGLKTLLETKQATNFQPTCK